ncbi:MAG: glycosyltransferase, partial [Candidatus Methylomirabilaceae bacterium]
MRILQVVHGFPPESLAGTERYCEALSRHLLQRGHECMVLAGSERQGSAPTLATVQQDGLLVTRYQRADGRPRRWTEEYDPEAEALTRRLLTMLRPDVVHLHQWQRLTNNLVAICADLGTPVVVTLHDAWTSCPRIHRIRRDGAFCPDPPASAPCLTCVERGPWQGDEEISRALSLRRELMATELALATTIIAPSEAHRAFLLTLLDLPGDRLAVVPHGRIPAAPARQESGQREVFPRRPLQIGHWGHLIYLKGAHLILEAVHMLRDPSAVQVHLIGTTIEPAYEQRLRDLARDIPVQFHGAYQSADLSAFDLDLAAFASIASESYSFAIDEALQMGIPVLVSDRGAPPERIGAAGVTFRAGDASDLARRLQEILDAPERLHTMRRSVRPERLFSMEAHVAMLEKIYEDAAHANQPRREAPTPYLKLIAHAQQDVREREEALSGLQDQLAEAGQALHDKEALVHEKEALVHEKEALLEEARHTLEALQADHAKLRSDLFELTQTPLV